MCVDKNRRSWQPEVKKRRSCILHTRYLSLMEMNVEEYLPKEVEQEDIDGKAKEMDDKEREIVFEK